MSFGRADYWDSVLFGACGFGAIGERDARSRRCSRNHDVLAARGGARVYLCLQAAQFRGMEKDIWAVPPPVSRQLPARAVFARLCAAFAGMVCAEASG